MKSVIVIEKKWAAQILKDYKGHTLKNVIVHDGSHTEQMTRDILLEFSDEPAQEQLLTIEEQQLALESFKHQAKTGGPMGSYAGFHCLMADRLIPDVDGGE